MRNAAKLLTAAALAALMAGPSSRSAVLQAQAPAAPAPQTPGQPTFRVSVDLVTTDVIVRDQRSDQFVADIKPGEFEVYEDGVKQEIASLVLTHGGRVYNQLSPPPAPVQEGIILPRNRPTNDAAGRVFLLFIDDLHLDFRSTPRTRELIKKMLRLLIHEGDMFGMVSTGTSSISEQLTYDRQILESAISRITGGGLRPKEIIEGMQGSQGPGELRHRAHVAFSTAYDLMRNLEKLQNRRKAVIYLSSGYDFNPFETSRLDEQARRMHVESADLQNDPFYRTQQSSQLLAESDLVRELAELTRAANRANATIYTIDPRGLVAGPDMDDEVPTQEWQTYVRETQDSLRVLAEETGGIAVVNQNDFDKALKRIDNETSDYYVLGYYSSNPDPLKRIRKIEVKTTRTGLNVYGRSEYVLRPLPPPSNR
ncbi:MAG TPA: VWA domain-containing protein [Vicinamibacterales bacterium]|nr:VWA domain-containing protein [Vicinamibacterales bacterium]